MPILCQLMSIFAQLLDMDFTFVFPSIYINFDIQSYAYFVPIEQLMSIFAQLLDMDFTFVFPSIYINFDIQNKFEVNQTEIGYSIQKHSKNSPKWPYLKTPFCRSVIHQKAYSSYIFQ